MQGKRAAALRLAMSLLATVGLALASVVWSESWFYARWRVTDSAFNSLQTVAGYALVVQVARLISFRWRVASVGPGAWRRVFLVGALFGWLVEGVLATTVTTRLPLSISYTGLAWHALFTVLLGWWWVPRQLERPILRSTGWLCLVGLGVGLWATFWRYGHGTTVSVLDYALFVTATTSAYAGGLALWWAFRTRANPGWRGSALALAALCVIAAFNGISNPLTLLGLVLIGLAVFALYRTTRADDTVPLLPTGGPTPWRALWRLVFIPAAAIAVYAVSTSPQIATVTGWTYVIVTSLLGAVLFVLAWWRARLRRS